MFLWMNLHQMPSFGVPVCSIGKKFDSMKFNALLQLIVMRLLTRKYWLDFWGRMKEGCGFPNSTKIFRMCLNRYKASSLASLVWMASLAISHLKKWNEYYGLVQLE